MRRMFTMGLRHPAKNGACVVYATPWEKWLPVIRSGTKTGSIAYRSTCEVMPCLVFPRSAWSEAASLGAGLVASTLARFTLEHSALWEKAAEEFPFGFSAVRSPESLQFKNGGGTTLEVRVESSGELVGYASIKKGSGLLTEFIAGHPDRVGSVVGALAAWMVTASRYDADFDSIQFMESAPVRGVKTVPGCTLVDFKFGFFSIVLDSSLNDVALDAERWYITPGD